MPARRPPWLPVSGVGSVRNNSAIYSRYNSALCCPSTLNMFPSLFSLAIIYACCS